MMMKLMKEVERLSEEELEEANKNYPLFASDHEGASVLREELEEADDDLAEMWKTYNRIWNQIKHDSEMLTLANELKEIAMHCASECIQVSAMCDKLKMK